MSWGLIMCYGIVSCLGSMLDILFQQTTSSGVMTWCYWCFYNKPKYFCYCTQPCPLFNFNGVLNCNFLLKVFDRWKKTRLSARQPSYSSHPKLRQREVVVKGSDDLWWNCISRCDVKGLSQPGLLMYLLLWLEYFQILWIILFSGTQY